MLSALVTTRRNPAYILLGFKEGVTREEWEKYYYADDLKALENLCHKIPVKAGEAYFVGGGCPHALGEGCFVIEVQEPSDYHAGCASLQCNAGSMARRRQRGTL